MVVAKPKTRKPTAAAAAEAAELSPASPPGVLTATQRGRGRGSRQYVRKMVYDGLMAQTGGKLTKADIIYDPVSNRYKSIRAIRHGREVYDNKESSREALTRKRFRPKAAAH